MGRDAYPNVEPTTRSFLETLRAAGGKPLYELTPEKARKVLSELQTDHEKLPVEFEDRTLPCGPGVGDVPVRIVRPKGTTGALPAIMYFHGGGWVLGGKDTHDRLIRDLANRTGAAVVFVEYTLAPEAKYPVQNEQAYAATKWIAENGGSLGLDSSHLVVAGDSVGGNMATVVTMMAKERKGPKIDLQVLFYPVTDDRFDTGSYKEYASGYFLEREGMKWFWGNYLARESDGADPTASPLRASPDQLEGLPPALILFGENDVLRDEVEAYAHKLAAAGVPVTASRCLGTIHDFVMLDPLAETPATRGAIRQASDTIRRTIARGAPAASA
ncbi:alpha/beta hydrolase [Vulgatibacter incomptus]|uniref:Esterase/lipase n=1 Tax=Vulgatibacter incomptus TaxID=1391653 RepID=A0A0K1PF85_9BACT|nr:alpha/beta hydrolase [Vulgatibacter incomptus]AKU91764.1 Esterase/lipase [Vulgatibacter incomptus]